MNVNDKQVGGDHYKGDLQHWDLMEKYEVPYLEGCATKYISRHRKKNGRQDLEKSIHYVEKIISVMQLSPRRGNLRMLRRKIPEDVLLNFYDSQDMEAQERICFSQLVTPSSVLDLELVCIILQSIIDFEYPE